ncbi:proteasome subunit alpha type-7-1B [Drosophila miranda]|uniref:proteasome subunit alpha type-7-1B n=1 Tax=Drosophila miranda TaxID=7229 RepID=UPI0007E64863|nr:proteasome subunit alpha type-7-1B [Drosophila miranda]
MSDRYDRAVTIYSPDGHLLQVEYAQEAVRRGSTAVGLRTNDCIVVGVEKRSSNPLFDERSMRKISMLDNHVVMTFAGLTADARVLISRAQAEAQSYRLNFERPVTVEYITRFIAQMKQNYTQSNGRRPFGLSCLMGGFDGDGKPHLYQTEPSGIYYEWTGSSTGRAGTTAREYMEKHAGDTVDSMDEQTAVKHVVRTLMSGTEQSEPQLDVAVLRFNQPLRMVERQALDDHIRAIRGEIEAEVKTRLVPNKL